MSLFNILVHLPHEQLRRLANEFGISSASPSKRTILNELSLKYRDEQFLSRLIKNIPDSSFQILRYLVFFTLEQETISFPDFLLHRWEQINEGEGLHSLLDIGFIFRDASLNNGQWIFPEEVRQSLKHLLVKPYDQLQPLHVMDGQELSNRVPCLESVFHLAAMILHHPVKQTLKGVLHRKAIQRWISRMGIKEVDPIFLSFTQHYCMEHNLLHEHHNRYRITPETDSWFAQNDKILYHSMWEYFVQDKVISDDILPSLFVALRSSQTWIQTNRKSPVYSVTDLQNLWNTQERQSLSHQKLLHYLTWFAFMGVIQFDNPDSPGTFFFTRRGIELLFHFDLDDPVPTESETCIVQPNFDLLVPPTVGYSTLWKLEQIAEFKKRDVFTEYHLSQQSILHALRRGWNRESLLTFVHHLSRGKISSNIQYSLEEWCDKYGQVTFRPVVLIECKTKALADEIEHIPDVNTFIEERIADRVFSVPKPNARRVMQILRQKGYEPAIKKRPT